MIKFIDHDSFSRITMDYVQGELLVDKVKNTSGISKDMIFSWFYNLLIQMTHYHKCGNNSIYRYLNPYSVVIMGSGEVHLLDMDSSSNSFVIKNLQTPSMREHFLKPKIQQTEENQIGYDIYCFGKTLQYTLACCESSVYLSKSEDNKCFNLIEKCINRDSKKKYNNFIQIKRDLSFANVKRRNIPISSNKRLKIIIGVVIVVVVANIIFGLGLSVVFPKGNSEVNEAVEQDAAVGLELKVADSKSDGEDVIEGIGGEELKKEEVKNEGLEGNGNTNDVAVKDELEESLEVGAEIDITETPGESPSLEKFLQNLEEDVNRLLSYLHSNDKEDNERIIFYGEEMEMTILRVLAMAYDREEHKEQAILAYGRQIALENREEHLERAFIRKMKLEEELGWITQAIETGKQGLEILGRNIDIAKIYLEMMMNSELFSKEEVRREYERLLEFVKELKDDEVEDRIERMEESEI